MTTNPVRVPASVHSEVNAAARVLGCNTAELLEKAWNVYRHSPEFASDFDIAQKAFATGDLDYLASRMQEQAAERAQRRAAAVQQLRS